MPQLPAATVKARAARLREAAARRRTAWLDRLIGTRPPVLIENSEKGHSARFAPVRVAGSLRGDGGTVLITARDSDTLVGEFE